ncbi:MAG: SDR family NAD(P)-dependent oxidoreductase [Planctomycetes bacterium]|nr:SDR family NAD(P)-dependent oxidoreductase [Planctomycetota bacterium]
MTSESNPAVSSTDIAIVGMAAHLPGAPDVRAYWQNLRAGVESIRDLSVEELQQAGVKPGTYERSNYVRRSVVLQDMDRFDASFFGFTPKDAAITDPQHRHFLETCWEALEDAGHTPSGFGRPIGVFAGSGMAAYFAFNILSNPKLVDEVGIFLLRHTGNDKDFLATRVSYELDLRGPSINVQTACSTSLVAVHVAIQSLLSGECDMALAGGVTISLPHGRGYTYHENEILAIDGRCRPFDADSSGTLFGSGSAVVVLRRLEDALKDGDHVYAVVKGSAINNDGALKVGYLAPSVDGQAQAIAEALTLSGVEADSIDYVEAHGTATKVGDPIEVAALTQAFRASSTKTGFCGLGSVKSNIGHLDTAAGAASLIKVALALEHQELPASLHYRAPNPEIDFAKSPFYVNAALKSWPRGARPRRAGVNSLGVGGTNAHVIVEEAPLVRSARARRPLQLLCLSARTPSALDAATERLRAHLAERPELSLADVAWTLQVGRESFAHRRSLVARDTSEALRLLAEKPRERVSSSQTDTSEKTLAFLLPGGGAQYVGMGRGLYESEPIYRQHLDACLALLSAELQTKLRRLLLQSPCSPEERAAWRKELERPSVQLPALFATEYSLARFWMSLGLEPQALLGHSMGENTAACLAEVLSLKDAMGLVALRGQLFERVEKGGMLSVNLAPDALRALLPEELSLAVVNAPELCVASGRRAALDALEATLKERGVDFTKIHIDIAAHSALLEPILPEFRAYLRSIRLSPPRIPFVSNRTGTWITDAQATDPEYWVQHLRGTVLFSSCVQTLIEDRSRLFLEVGPGNTLSSLTRLHGDPALGKRVMNSLRHHDEQVDDLEFTLGVLGKLWGAGAKPDWRALHGEDQRLRVSLPGYPFERSRFWIEPGQRAAAAESEESHPLTRQAELEKWFHAPRWVASELGASELPKEPLRWLCFEDEAGVAESVRQALVARGHRVVRVRAGLRYEEVGADEFVVCPTEAADYVELLDRLEERGLTPQRIVHAWALTEDESTAVTTTFFHVMQEHGFYSLLFLGQALAHLAPTEPIHLCVLTNGMQQVEHEGLPHPVKACVLGPVKVIPREVANVTAASIDLDWPIDARHVGAKRKALLASAQRSLLAELASPRPASLSAWRDGKRFVQELAPAPIAAAPAEKLPVREQGTYLVTGGLGGIGLAIAQHLASRARVRFALVARHALPPRDTWSRWLASHDAHDATSQRLRRLLELEAQGAEVLVGAADVANPLELGAFLAEVRQRWGRLHGVIHAAGVVEDGVLPSKTPASVDRVFAPKIQGTLQLEELLAGETLDFFVAFSSTSAWLGPAGQIDYTAANAFLDAFAQHRTAKTKQRTLAIGWGVWSEVGMAARLVEPNPEPARTDRNGHHEASALHPLLGKCLVREPREIAYLARYRSDALWLLDEHRLADGTALIPGTGYLELARAAADLGDALAIRDLSFLSPLVVAEGEERAVLVRLAAEPDASWRFEVSSRAAGAPDDEEWQLHAQARLERAGANARAPLALAELRARCGTIANDALDAQKKQLRFGPRWNVVQELRFGNGEALALLELPAAFRDELATYKLHPALLDLATGFALRLLARDGERADEVFYAPLGYARVRVHGALPARVVSHARLSAKRPASAELALFDIAIADEAGRVLLEIEEFALRRFAASTALGSAHQKNRAGRAAAKGGTRGAHVDPTLQRMVEQGIRPKEGAEAFERVLASGRSGSILVSSIDPAALRAALEQKEREDENPQTAAFARPALASDFLAPRDEIEQGLAKLWQELLGVEQVGVQDDFFALGGYSLIAVRLFARVKKTWKVEFPLAVLFEAPTIELLAARLRDELGESFTASAPTGAPAAPPKKRKFRHLVLLHTAEASATRPPFFLVAGMYGNVMNLRHLAGHLGSDQLVYGIQARGVEGSDDPDETFEAMAERYIAELREVQPQGPYVIGGYSGGGIAAYEMAQQLTAAGEQVALLVFLDTPVPLEPPLTAGKRLKLARLRLQKHGPGIFVGAAVRKLKHQGKRLKSLVQKPLVKLRPADFRTERIEAAFYRALERYELRPYAGRVALFRPPQDAAFQLGPDHIVNEQASWVEPLNGWGPWIEGGPELHLVTGDHDNMVLEPNVRVLASQLRTAIDQALAPKR